MKPFSHKPPLQTEKFTNDTYKTQLKKNQKLFESAQDEIEQFHKRNNQIRQRLDNCLNSL